MLDYDYDKQNYNVFDYDYIEYNHDFNRDYIFWNVFRKKTKPTCMVWRNIFSHNIRYERIQETKIRITKD